MHVAVDVFVVVVLFNLCLNQQTNKISSLFQGHKCCQLLSLGNKVAQQIVVYITQKQCCQSKPFPSYSFSLSLNLSYFYLLRMSFLYYRRTTSLICIAIVIPKYRLYQVLFTRKLSMATLQQIVCFTQNEISQRHRKDGAGFY